MIFLQMLKKMKKKMREEDEEKQKRLDVGGSVLYTIDLDQTVEIILKILDIIILTERTEIGNRRIYKGPV